MSPMSQFVRSVLPLHEIADVRQLAKGDQVKVAEFKRFLLAYLEEARESPRSASHLLVSDGTSTGFGPLRATFVNVRGIVLLSVAIIASSNVINIKGSRHHTVSISKF